LVSEYGIFIVETKNRTGWIYGSEEQSTWTQVLRSKKYTFQNPLRQTYRQKKVLAEFLRIYPNKIQTVIFFVGDCKFKTKMPDNVLKHRLSTHIKQYKNKVFSQEYVLDIIHQLEEFTEKSNLTKRDHMRSLNDRHSSTTKCPRCGSALVERKARNGKNAGNKFLGCSNYPGCKFTRSLWKYIITNATTPISSNHTSSTST